MMLQLAEMGNGSAFFADDLLGEGPHWDEDREVLSRVDIHGGRLRICDPVTGEQSTQSLEAPAAFAIPRRDGGYVVGIGMTVVLFDRYGERTTLLDLSAERRQNRFNDAVCDSRGRLWAGTMSSHRPDRIPGDAALYRIDPDGAYEVVLPGLTLSNGMDWPDDGTILHIDSDAHRIDSYDVDVEPGRLGRRRTLTEIDPSAGLPDGLTLDDEGSIWVAFFGGSEVRRYAADGVETARLPMPVSCPTSVAFGGADLGDLFVTTSRHRLSEAEAARQPLAGSLLRLRPGVRGRTGYRFAG